MLVNATFRQARKASLQIRLTVVAALPLLLVACAGPTSPVAPRAMGYWMASTQVIVAGASVNGMTMSRGQLVGDSTFFQGTLTGPSGPVPGETVQVLALTPHGPGMMLGQNVMTLYDDGTHGDPTPGDGTYGFEDLEGLFGFHMQHAPLGEYHYEFFGTYHDDEHTEHMEVVVTIVAQ
jgi:hypothetical protein